MNAAALVEEVVVSSTAANADTEVRTSTHIIQNPTNLSVR